MSDQPTSSLEGWARHHTPVLYVVGTTCLLCLIAVAYAMVFKGAAMQNTVSNSTSNVAVRPAESNSAGTLRNGEIAYVNTLQLNIRSAPGSESAVVTKLSRGDSILCLDRGTSADGGAWIRVRAGSFEGWVNEKLVSKEKPTPVLENLSAMDATLTPGSSRQGFAFQKDGAITLLGNTFGRCKIDPKYPESSEVYISGPSPARGYYYVLCWVEHEGGISAQIVKGHTGGIIASNFIPKDWGVGKWVSWSPEDRYAITHAVGEVTMGDMVFIDLQGGRSEPLHFRHIATLARNNYQPEIQYIDKQSIRWLDSHRFTIRLYVTCNPYEVENCDTDRVLRQNSVTVDLDTGAQQYN